MHCYRLRFRAPFHVDGRGTGFYQESEPFIRSDTLSAAVLSAWALLEPEQVEARAARPPFLLSSAFPYWREHYFLPRPVATVAMSLPESRLRESKPLKKLQWLSSDLWLQAAAAGERWLAPTDLVLWQEVLALLTPSQTEHRPDWLWAEEERPRLAVDRANDGPVEGQLFHFSRIHFDREGGLYVLAKFFEDGPARAGFEAALRLLGDSGLGADRNSGNGLFEWEVGQPPTFPEPASGAAIALSLVSPAPEDMQGDWLAGAKYGLVSRGGWIGAGGLRRRRLRMFAEGSQFVRPLGGQVVDVTPAVATPYRVYRDGRGFFVGTGGGSA